MKTRIKIITLNDNKQYFYTQWKPFKYWPCWEYLDDFQYTDISHAQQAIDRAIGMQKKSVEYVKYP